MSSLMTKNTSDHALLDAQKYLFLVINEDMIRAQYKLVQVKEDNQDLYLYCYGHELQLGKAKPVSCPNSMFIYLFLGGDVLVQVKYLSEVVPEDSHRRYEGPDEARNSTDGIDGVAHSKGDSTGGEAEDQVGKHEEVAIWGDYREDENIEDKENGLLESVLEDSRRPVDHRL
ncbi:hypothetical protein TYRP_005361 [Tyrophagus putrescentiae]|nr:hypothetical protein TYRP_005361 [Tyrophagus putrescentiae]